MSVVILLRSQADAPAANKLVDELAKFSIPAVPRLVVPLTFSAQTVIVCFSQALLEQCSFSTLQPALLYSEHAAALLQCVKILALCNEQIRAKLFNKLQANQTALNVADCEVRSKAFEPRITPKLNSTFSETNLPYGSKYIGKVRDRYQQGDKMILITTDRLTGFDRPLCKIPYKGQVLNLISQYWFAETSHIIKNHLLSVPHPNVSIGMECTVFPIEFVVRAYLTGSSGTSIWTHYNKGIREYCGLKLPDGMKQNQAFPQALLTPTTKSDEHDELISAAEIVEQKWMSKDDWEFCAAKCLEIFAHAQRVARARGLVLVDTKMEFGRNVHTGEIVLIDELLTPDSSRYWLAEGLEEAIERGEPPANIDKEFVRLWFRDHCDPYKDEVLPEAPEDIRVELARRYIMLYELITGNEFEFLSDDKLQESVEQALQTLSPPGSSKPAGGQ